MARRRWRTLPVSAALVCCFAAACADGESVRLRELTPPTEPAQSYVFPAMGGVRIDALEAHDVYATGDRVMIDTVGGFDPFHSGAAYLGLATQGVDGTVVPDVEGFLDRLDGLDIVSTGDAIEVFGFELMGFEISSGGQQTTAFTSTRLGAEGRHVWTPDRDVVYLADTPAGVLYTGYDHGGAPDNPVALRAFALLVRSAELTGPGLDEALPAGTTPSATGPAPTPARVAEEGPGPLIASRQEVPAGRYQLPNFGQALTLELGGWTVRPNQPGIVALTSANSVGAGDAAVVFVGGLAAELVPQTGGPRQIDDPIDLSDIQRFLDDPPEGLEISDVLETEVAGLPAIRFDARIASDRSCAQDDPCEFAFRLAWQWNFAVAIEAELSHRIWWFPEHPTGMAMIHASDLDPAFLDRAAELVDSAEPVVTG